MTGGTGGGVGALSLCSWQKVLRGLYFGVSHLLGAAAKFRIVLIEAACVSAQRSSKNIEATRARACRRLGVSVVLEASIRSACNRLKALNWLMVSSSLQA